MGSERPPDAGVQANRPKLCSILCRTVEDFYAQPVRRDFTRGPFSEQDWPPHHAAGAKRNP